LIFIFYNFIISSINNSKTFSSKEKKEFIETLNDTCFSAEYDKDYNVIAIKECKRKSSAWFDPDLVNIICSLWKKDLNLPDIDGWIYFETPNSTFHFEVLLCISRLNTYLFFIWFMHLCNSFMLIHIKYSTKFISRDSKNKLNMGCDYYIDKNLDLYDYNDTMFSFINLEHERCYYLLNSLFDEDEDGYDTQLAQYIKETLEPNTKPIVIFSNNTFHKLSFEHKYKKIIEDRIQLFNKTLNDVSKILKTENRYERW
jgi:hypothetical protein